MTEKLTYIKLATGDLLCKERPIRLSKPLSRSPEQPGWQIRVPIDPDATYPVDRWRWTSILKEDSSGTLEAASEREARALVVEHLAHVIDWTSGDYMWTEARRLALIADAQREQRQNEEWLAQAAPATRLPAAPAPTIEETNGWRCACGCQTPVPAERVYAPGHHARHRDQLVDLLVGTGSLRSRANRLNHLIAGFNRGDN